MLIGLAVGFLGASITIEVVDRLGNSQGSGERLEVVLGHPDLAAFCEQNDSGLVVTSSGPGPENWHCSGPVDGLFTTISIDLDEVCRTQFEPGARARLFEPDDPDGWRCIADP